MTTTAPCTILAHQALFAEELNEANERASFFQARVAQLEAEAEAAVGGPKVADTGGSRPSNVKAMLTSAADWVALSNRWSISGGDHEVRACACTVLGVACDCNQRLLSSTTGRSDAYTEKEKSY